jgi:hypothetical protein
MTAASILVRVYISLLITSRMDALIVYSIFYALKAQRSLRVNLVEREVFCCCATATAYDEAVACLDRILQIVVDSGIIRLNHV